MDDDNVEPDVEDEDDYDEESGAYKDAVAEKLMKVHRQGMKAKKKLSRMRWRTSGKLQ